MNHHAYHFYKFDLGTSMIFLTLFAITFCIVIMNLLVNFKFTVCLIYSMNFKVGVALSDINYHMKRGNRMQLIAEIDMISKYGAVKRRQLILILNIF